MEKISPFEFQEKKYYSTYLYLYQIYAIVKRKILYLGAKHFKVIESTSSIKREFAADFVHPFYIC